MHFYNVRERNNGSVWLLYDCLLIMRIARFWRVTVFWKVDFPAFPQDKIPYIKCGCIRAIYSLINILTGRIFFTCFIDVCVYVCIGWGFNRNVLTPTLPLLYFCQINIWIYVYTRVYIPKYMYTLLMANK